MSSALPPVDLKNVQGDVLEGLAKKFETFFFFCIDNDVDNFRKQLATFLPLITSVNEARGWRTKISEGKKTKPAQGVKQDLIPLLGFNIAFSQKGLTKLGIYDDLKEPVFSAGMLKDAPNLDDDLETWDADFKKHIDGVIIIAAASQHLIDSGLDTLTRIFDIGRKCAGLHKVKALDGHIRPGDEAGHEHFGFNDGLSQPAVKDITTDIQPGQETVRQGVILLGREFDNGIAPPGGAGPGPLDRPRWALDSSFLAFRYLKQLVPEFNAFIHAHALTVATDPPPPADSNGAELIGARLVGRWKSGAPVDTAPVVDNDDLAKPDQNQNFRYDPDRQTRCPFTAHTRKTNPRADLDEFGGTEVRRIIRRGIQFGREVTPEEAKAQKSSEKPELERGLLFACYQSNLSNGFQFIQQSWANNPTFPPGKGAPPTDPIVPSPPGPGIDPIIGRGARREMLGTDPDNVTAELQLPSSADAWVVPKGGEYFISPSIEALTTVFARASGERPLRKGDDL